jgi:hypothetical protein
VVAKALHWLSKRSDQWVSAESILLLEDSSPGQRFAGRTRIRIDGSRVRTFATEFEPRPFHLDEGAASVALFRGLAASCHTAAVTMRPLVDSDGLGLLGLPRQGAPRRRLRLMAHEPASKRWRVRLARLVAYWAAGVATAAGAAFTLKALMRATGLAA